MRGRLPAGPEYVEKLRGPDEAKRRLEVILRTLAGDCRVAEACELLGVGESRFHTLRQTALQAALDGLVPRPAGRPATPQQPPGEAEQQRRQAELRLELEAARLREEIALVLPRLAGRAESGKRGRRRKGGRRQ
jgi:hypothetical protein